MGFPASSEKSAIQMGFFRRQSANQPHTHNALIEPVWAPLGANEKGAFLAVAATLIDKDIPTRSLSTGALKRLLSCHFKLFPADKTTLVGLHTPKERWEHLVKQVQASKLVRNLAKTLHKIASDELNSHPEQYALGYVLTHNTASSWQEHPYFSLPLAILSQALGSCVELQVACPGKELPIKIKYNEQATPQFKIQQVGHQYFAVLNHGGRFKLASSQHLQQTPVKNEEGFELFTDDDVYKKMLAELESILNAYHDVSHRLMVMVKAGELGLEQLQAIYSSVIDIEKQDKTHPYFGTELGCQEMIDVIASFADGTRAQPLDGQRKLCQNLVDAIASSVSLGRVSLENLFSQVDEKETAVRLQP